MPVRQLQRVLTSADFTELIAAELCGLVPDPWQQTGTICKAIADFSGEELTVPPQVSDFIPMDRRHERQDLQRIYWQRKASYASSLGRPH